MDVVTLQPMRLSYFIADIATAMLSFDRLRIWRSRTGSSGLYEQATAAVPGPAVLRGVKDTPFQLNGMMLSLQVNGNTTIDVVFTDPDPVTIAQVVTAIDTETALVIPSDEDDQLGLTTVAEGTAASIEILASDAAPYLGLESGAAAVGTDEDLELDADVHEYLYIDQNSSPDFWYRVELINSSTLQTSGLGPPFQMGHVGVPDTERIWCYLDLIDLSGRPLAGRVVTFTNLFLPNVVVTGSSPNIVRHGVFRHYAQITTDSDGHAQIRLLRGATIDFTVDGTNFIRRIAIPTTGDAVDLLNPTLVVEDEFGIQEPDVDFAVRTT